MTQEEIKKERDLTSSLFDQMATITKAHAYDILREQLQELESENETLKIELKAANALLKAYQNFVADIKPLFATTATLPQPKESENDIENINI
jgi:nitric oxide reductase activation protein